MQKIAAMPFRAMKDGIELFVRATPKASKEKIDGIAFDAGDSAYFKIHITAIPEDNQANKAIIGLLANFLSLPKSAITQKSGLTHCLKSFHLKGISTDEVEDLPRF
ncbi:MAG: DUF167 family protein [Candidatus Paracaedibacteraceae bacterium]|nr:DUF167 family protein [Candidatus Paracaedibacteraceae bacterium]